MRVVAMARSANIRWRQAEGPSSGGVVSALNDLKNTGLVFWKFYSRSVCRLDKTIFTCFCIMSWSNSTIL